MTIIIIIMIIYIHIRVRIMIVVEIWSYNGIICKESDRIGQCCLVAHGLGPRRFGVFDTQRCDFSRQTNKIVGLNLHKLEFRLQESL